MASTTGGTSSSGSGSTTHKQLPRDAIVMQTLLQEMGVKRHEQRVVNQMLDFVYRYVTNVVEEAKAYSSYAKKKTIDADDVKLAVKMMNNRSFTTVPPRELLLELAKAKNSQPLPLLKSTSGLRLPPDRFCLTQPNYHLEFYKKAIASSRSQESSNVKLPGSSVVFKTPQAPGRMVTAGNIQYAGATSVRTPTITVVSTAHQQLTQGVKRKLSDEDGFNSTL